MNAATLLTLAVFAIEVVMGALSLAFGRAEGWRHFRTFAIVAFWRRLTASETPCSRAVHLNPAW